MLRLLHPFRNCVRFHFTKSNKEQILKLRNDYSNVSPKILDLVDQQIHKIEGHPLNTIKERLRRFFQDQTSEKSVYRAKMGNPIYEFLENESPIGDHLVSQP